jgi:hypothetical protein
MDQHSDSPQNDFAYARSRQLCICFLSILENVFFRRADGFFGGGEVALFTKSEFLRLDV